MHCTNWVHFYNTLFVYLGPLVLPIDQGSGLVEVLNRNIQPDPNRSEGRVINSVPNVELLSGRNWIPVAALDWTTHAPPAELSYNCWSKDITLWLGRSSIPQSLTWANLSKFPSGNRKHEICRLWWWKAFQDRLSVKCSIPRIALVTK